MFPGPAGDLDDERVCQETVGVRGESSREPGGGKAGKSLSSEGKRPSRLEPGGHEGLVGHVRSLGFILNPMGGQ